LLDARNFEADFVAPLSTGLLILLLVFVWKSFQSFKRKKFKGYSFMEKLKIIIIGFKIMQ